MTRARIWLAIFLLLLIAPVAANIWIGLATLSASRPAHHGGRP